MKACAVNCTKVTFTLPDATCPSARAQKWRFCARKARKQGLRRPKKHKNLDFVLEKPENGDSEGQKRTKTSILCSKCLKWGFRSSKAHKITLFVLGRANPCLPQRGNSPLCRLGATVRDAASGQLSPLPPSGNSPPCRRVRTSGPGSAVAERNLGAARPLPNVIVAAYPLRTVNGSRLLVA